MFIISQNLPKETIKFAQNFFNILYTLFAC